MGQEIFSARGESASGRNYPSEDSKLKTVGSFTFLLSSLSSFFHSFPKRHQKQNIPFLKKSLEKFY
jgi:hypothetical protein